MSKENLPPLPGTEKPEPPKPSYTAYKLSGCGQQWIEIGTAIPHPDGKGHRLNLTIGMQDGETIELRALDPKHYPQSPSRKPLSQRQRKYNRSNEF